jgi:hypothetical protein
MWMDLSAEGEAMNRPQGDCIFEEGGMRPMVP